MIDNLLLDFFRQNGRMVVPGKGIILHVNIEDRGLDTVAFVNDESIDGSEVTEYIGEALGTDAATAAKILDGYVALMDSMLAKNGEYVFEGIGTLRLDDKGAVYMVNRRPASHGEKVAVAASDEIEKMPSSAPVSPSLEKKEEAVGKVDDVYQGDMTEDSELSEHEPPVPPVVGHEPKAENVSVEEKVAETQCGIIDSPASGGMKESVSGETAEPADTEQVKEFLDEMREDFAEENAMNEVKRLLEEKERHERLSEIFTSKRCFNDEAGERRGEVSTLQMRLNNNEDSHIHSEKIEDLYKGDLHRTIAGEQVKHIKDNDMKTDVPATPGAPVKKKKRLDTVWIIFIIAVLGLIGVTIYYFYEKNTIDGNLNVPAVEEVIDQPVM